MSNWQIFLSSTVPPIEMDILLFGCIWKYPTRRQPNHQTFARVYQILAEHGILKASIEDTEGGGGREHLYNRECCML